MPKTLLLADDSITIQKVVGIIFASEDYSVTTVNNGEDALAKVRAQRPDLVLADVVMPRKNGYELCEALKSDPELKDVPVLLLAGTFEAFDESRARAVQADGWIQKPFDSATLLGKVREVVEGIAPPPAPTQPYVTAAPRPAAPPAPAVAPPPPGAPLPAGARPLPGAAPSRPFAVPPPLSVQSPQPLSAPAQPFAPRPPAPPPPPFAARPPAVPAAPVPPPPPVFARPPAPPAPPPPPSPTFRAPPSRSDFGALDARPAPTFAAPPPPPPVVVPLPPPPPPQDAAPEIREPAAPVSSLEELDFSQVDEPLAAPIAAPPNPPAAPAIPSLKVSPPVDPEELDFDIDEAAAPIDLADLAAEEISDEEALAADEIHAQVSRVPPGVPSREPPHLDLSSPWDEPMASPVTLAPPPLPDEPDVPPSLPSLPEDSFADLFAEESRTPPAFELQPEPEPDGQLLDLAEVEPEAELEGHVAEVEAAAEPFAEEAFDADREPAFAAMPSFPEVEPTPEPALELVPAPAAAPMDADEVALRDVLSRASRETIERVVWEVVPQLAEEIIREHLERLMKDRKNA